jgi:hypothetical protein
MTAGEYFAIAPEIPTIAEYVRPSIITAAMFNH